MKEVSAQHKIIEAEDYITLVLEGELVQESVNFLAKEQQLVLASAKPLVVHCAALSGLCPAWVRALMTVHLELSKKNRKMRFIQVTDAIKRYFRAEGVDGVFLIQNTLREALADFGVATKKALDTDFINPFLDSTIKVLEIQAQTKALPGRIYLKQGPKLTGDVSGVIGIVSDAFNGSVVISFPEGTFLKIVSRMFGEEHTVLTKEIEDGAAELTNIIFGQAKIILNDKGYGIKTALPSVITGKDHSVAATVKGAVVVIPFETDVGPFFIEVSTTV